MMAKRTNPKIETDAPIVVHAEARSFRPIPIRYVLPNLLTLMALCSGVTAIRFAVEKELAAEKKTKVNIDDLIARVAAMPNTGLKADKAFFDSLNDE